MDSQSLKTYTVNMQEGENAIVRVSVVEILKVDEIARHVMVKAQEETRLILHGDRVRFHDPILGAITPYVSGMLIQLEQMPQGQWLYLDANQVALRNISFVENQPTASKI